MALEQYAKIVDSIVRGAEQLRTSLERATAKQARGAATARTDGTSVDGGASRPAGFAAAGGHRVLDLFGGQFTNARSISASLFGSTGESPAAATSARAAAGLGGRAAAAGRMVAAAATHPVTMVIAALSSVTVGLTKMASSLKGTAEAAWEARRALAEIHPGMAAVVAMKDLAKRREDYLIASATVGSARRQLSAYRFAAAATRDWDIFAANIGANLDALWTVVKAGIVTPLNLLAKGLNRIIGWEAKLPKSRQEALGQTPLLRGLERWKRAEPSRMRAPRPYNRRP